MRNPLRHPGLTWYRALTPLLLGACLFLPGVAICQPASETSSTSAPAEAAPENSAEEKRLPEDVEQLLGMARAAPAEYTADILFRLIDSDRVVLPEHKLELLEEAFKVGSRVQRPLPLIPARSPAPIDLALSAGVSGLSIQTKAITGILSLNRERARELFSQLGFPQPGIVHCQDTSMPTWDAFYLALRQIVSRGFDRDEQRDEQHLQLLLSHVQTMTSSSQLTALATMLLDSNLSRQQRQVFADAYAARLGSVHDSARAFDSFAQDNISSMIYGLAVDAELGKISIQNFAVALRSYLVRHLAGARCADSAVGGAHSTRVRALVARFNNSLAELAALEPIGEDALPPLENAGGPPLPEHETLASAKPMLAALDQLRWKDAKSETAVEERKEQEWERKASDFLHQLAGWKPPYGLSELDAFHVKSRLYGNAIDLIPGSELKEEALMGFLEFLSGGAIHTSRPDNYLVQLKTLIRLAQADRQPPQRESEIWEAMKGSKNLVVALYGYAQDVAPTRQRR